MIKEAMLEQESCPRCKVGTTVNDVSTGELCCNNCGLVISERNGDQSQERSFVIGVEDINRTGNPASFTMYTGLSSVISYKNEDAFGKPISSNMQQTVERLRVWDKRSQINSSNRTFKKAFELLYRLRESLGLPDNVIEEAAYLYRKASKKHLQQGRTITSVLAASLYAACKNNEVPRTPDEISKTVNIPVKQLSRSYRLLMEELDLKVPVTDPLKCLSRIASKAGISEKTRRKAIKILQDASERGILAGKAPTSIASAALYLSCLMNNEEKSQGEISLAAGVTTATIRTRHHWLMNSLKLEFV